MSCKHKDIFGKPNEGIHSIRIPIPGLKNGIAMFDTVLALLFAYLIGTYYKMKTLHIIILFLALMVLGVIVHRFFCVDTPLTELLCKKEVPK
jgi:thiosulfate reductase cytochrome b subunit